MASINILPEELQNKIAAGEVIERPASVVKELLENALDASATEIRIEILDGGKKLIRVSDNGTGMDRDDAMICFHPHATSKIAVEEDLFNLKTLGFRGEALSSIAAVSRLRISTAPSDASLGISLKVQGGKVLEEREIAYRGTTIEVNDLFFNTPARRKFLKTRRTEVYHVIETVTETALSYPGTAFFLTVERVDTLILPRAREIKERIIQIYGDAFLRELIEVEGRGISALVSREGNFRGTRNNQYLFINRRPVRDASIRFAIYKSYENILPRDRHPIFFLYLDLDPASVDFNVHPTKREVRFKDKEMVYRLVYDSVRQALLKRGLSHTDHGHPKEQITGGSNHQARTVPSTAGDADQTVIEQQAVTSGLPFISEPSGGYGREFRHIYLGDVFVAYTEGKGVTLLDHHAAHERILYERLVKGTGIETTGLLLPRQVRLPAKEFEVIVSHIEQIKDLGFEIEEFGRNTIIIRALPGCLLKADIDAIVADMARCLIDIASNSPLDEIKDSIAKRVACHSSVRGKTELGGEEIAELLRELEKTEDPEHCPHGRPTRIHLDIDSLRKMFKRTGE
jgi:DNA mismatch repair protein MutL